MTGASGLGASLPSHSGAGAPVGAAGPVSPAHSPAARASDPGRAAASSSAVGIRGWGAVVVVVVDVVVLVDVVVEVDVVVVSAGIRGCSVVVEASSRPPLVATGSGSSSLHAARRART